MQKPNLVPPRRVDRIAVAVAVAVTLAVLVLTHMDVRPAMAEGPSFDFRQYYLAGDELRMVVETSVWRPRPNSNNLDTTDAKGWLLLIDLSKDGPVTGRARVFGPLWDVPNRRSSISFSAGVSFTEADEAAAAATPWRKFDRDGTLVRIRPQTGNNGQGGAKKDDVAGGATRAATRTRGGGPATSWTIERLVIERDGARWTSLGLHPLIDNYVSWPSEEQVDSNDGLYHLQQTDKGVALYEKLAGKKVEDPWLAKAFADLLAIKHLRNIQVWLTDDLKFLVCSPAYLWNRGRDKDPPSVETFELGSRVYSRKEYGLYFARPNPMAVVFKKEEGEGIALANGPSGAISIDGRLYLYYRKGDKLRLVGMNDGKPDAPAAKMTMDLPPERTWDLGMEKQHDASGGRLIFFAGRDLFKPGWTHGEELTAVVWNYRAGKLTAQTTRTADLFERKGDEYAPRAVMPIR